MSKYDDEMLEKAPVREEVPKGILQRIRHAHSTLKRTPFIYTGLRLFFLVLTLNFLRHEYYIVHTGSGSSFSRDDLPTLPGPSNDFANVSKTVGTTLNQ